MFDDFELESANLSKSDFVQIQQNPKNRLNLKNSKKVLEKFQSDTIAFHQKWFRTKYRLPENVIFYQ